MRYSGFFFCAFTTLLFWGAGQLNAENKRVERYDALAVSEVAFSGRFHKIELVAADKEDVELEVAGAEDVSQSVEAFLEDGVLYVQNAGSGSTQRVNNSLNVAVGNARSTLTIGNRTVSSSAGEPEISLTLRCSGAVGLQASGVFNLLSAIPLSRVDLKLLTGGSAHLEKCGSGDVRVECVGDASVEVFDVQHADAAVKVVGGGRADLKGSFRSVAVESVGANEVQISGPVSGTYTVSIIGKGVLTHRGRIAGRVEKFVTGKGRFIHVGE